MRLATLDEGGRDGTLVVVDPCSERMLVPPGGPATLQAALDDWDACAPALAGAYDRLLDGDGRPVELERLRAPLPRAYQWADASTYLAHMERLRAARGMPLPPRHDAEPIVYQSGSDVILAPGEPIALADERWGLDLEATVAVITGDVPVGTSGADAAAHVRLVVLANDLTLRNLLPEEYAKGVGLYRSKPARPYAPFAATPEALGRAWDGTTLHATVNSWVNGDLLGAVDAARDCAFDFAEVIAYMTKTRPLGAGTIIGSGTVSNRDTANGFACLAEKRAVEKVAGEEAVTPLLRPGDRVRIEAFDARGRSLFGAIDQRVVDARSAARAGATTTQGERR